MQTVYGGLPTMYTCFSTDTTGHLRRSTHECGREHLHHFKIGFTANLVVAASVGAYGSVLGLLAAQKGLTWLQLLVMNLSVFAGSAQFVMVDMWFPPLPIVEITMAGNDNQHALPADRGFTEPSF